MRVLRVKAEMYSKQNNSITLGGVYQSTSVVSMVMLSAVYLQDLTRGKEMEGQRNPTPVSLQF